MQNLDFVASRLQPGPSFSLTFFPHILLLLLISFVPALSLSLSFRFYYYYYDYDSGHFWEMAGKEEIRIPEMERGERTSHRNSIIKC